MRDTYTSENHRDFNARYAGTYGWLVQGGNRSLVHMIEGNDEFFTFNMGTSQTYKAYIDGGAVFEFIPIKMGWFNTNDGEVCFLERHPARQWKRGICESNTWVIAMRTYGLHGSQLNYKKLASIYLNPINTTKDYILARRNANTPVALSQHFSVSAVGEVYFYKTPVGVCNKDQIDLHVDAVKQELSDCIRRLELPWSVV